MNKLRNGSEGQAFNRFGGCCLVLGFDFFFNLKELQMTNFRNSKNFFKNGNIF